MRLDAVRVNDQWVPHSAQGVPEADRVHRMVQEAGLDSEELEHLSLEQQLHAARLVRVLEAYAGLRPAAIGYCQGMTEPPLTLCRSPGGRLRRLLVLRALHGNRTAQLPDRRGRDQGDSWTRCLTSWLPVTPSCQGTSRESGPRTVCLRTEWCWCSCGGSSRLRTQRLCGRFSGPRQPRQQLLKRLLPLLPQPPGCPLLLLPTCLALGPLGLGAWALPSRTFSLHSGSCHCVTEEDYPCV